MIRTQAVCKLFYCHRVNIFFKKRENKSELVAYFFVTMWFRTRCNPIRMWNCVCVSVRPSVWIWISFCLVWSICWSIVCGFKGLMGHFNPMKNPILTLLPRNMSVHRWCTGSPIVIESKNKINHLKGKPTGNLLLHIVNACMRVCEWRETPMFEHTPICCCCCCIRKIPLLSIDILSRSQLFIAPSISTSIAWSNVHLWTIFGGVL